MTQITLNGVDIRDVQASQEQARNARFTIGPLGTNLSFTGTDVSTVGPATNRLG